MVTLNHAERIGAGFGGVGVIFIIVFIYKWTCDYYERKRRSLDNIQRNSMLNEEVWGYLQSSRSVDESI